MKSVESRPERLQGVFGLAGESGDRFILALFNTDYGANI